MAGGLNVFDAGKSINREKWKSWALVMDVARLKIITYRAK
jgi:hypothetical protein